MTDKTFHARTTGLTLSAYSPAGDAATGRVLYKGETFTVSPEDYELSKDRIGRSWLDLTPEEQVARWGMQKFGTGPAPEDMEYAGDDEGYQYRKALAAKEYAYGISDPAERRRAQKAVADEYGLVLNPVAQGSQFIPAGH